MARVRVSILQRTVPLVCHRVLVIDPGRRQLKLLLAEKRFGRFRVVHRQAVEMPEEGTVGVDDIRQHMGLVLSELGPHQTAIVLPQHKTITQTIDVPHNHIHAPRDYLVNEARKLTGLSEQELALAFTRIQPYGTATHPCVMAFCKRKELDTLIEQFDPESNEYAHEDDQLIEITTTAQGLIAASRAFNPGQPNAVLVDLGAHETTVVVLLAGQGVFATSFEGGSNQFTLALLEGGVATPEEATTAQHSTDFFNGPTSVPSLITVVNKWHDELVRCLKEWLEDNSALKLGLADFPVYVAGGGAGQKGLIEHLNSLGQMRFCRWPNPFRGEPMDSFWVACGVARVALGFEPAALSFLPGQYQERRSKRALWEIVQAVILVLFALACVVLGLGTYKNSVLLKQKRSLIAQTTEALESAQLLGELTQQLETGYSAISPILERRNMTLVALQSWMAVNQVRTNTDFWMVLFADSVSYHDGTTAPQLSTNQPSPASISMASHSTTNAEFVAEVCIPQQGEPARRILSQFIASLKRLSIFSRVDALPTERKRELVDPRVMISNQVYGVTMDVAMQPLVPLNAEHRLRKPADPKPKPASSVPTQGTQADATNVIQTSSTP